MSQSIKPIKAIRGMNDLLPQDSYLWQHVEAVLRAAFAQYGFQEIRFPLVESSSLFKRTIGEVTDIVEKEMYSFDDRSGEPLSLRPEGTAGCVRAVIEHSLTHGQIQRLWYTGAMFRYERPQKGRYRQFHQLGAEVFGSAGPDADIELIALSARVIKLLGLSDEVTLNLNCLGGPEARLAHKAALVDYFTEHQEHLDEDSKRRLGSNPLRILDSKNPDMQTMISAAPSILDFLSEADKAHFVGLKASLDELGIDYVVNPRLVRGLDYYNLTVFEWVTERLGAQGAICGGGRYDGLVEQLGGKPTPAVGFAIGLERLISLVELVAKPVEPHVDVYMVLVGDKAELQGLKLAEHIRDHASGIKVLVNYGGGSFKSQFKRADKSGALVALVLGDDECENAEVAIKFLREDKPQQVISQAELIKCLQEEVIGRA